MGKRNREMEKERKDKNKGTEREERERTGKMTEGRIHRKKESVNQTKITSHRRKTDKNT